MLAGVFHFRQWEDFYLEHRARGAALLRYHVSINDPGARQKALSDFHRAADKINGFRKSYKKWNFIQTWGLLLGLTLVAAFVIVTTSIH